MTFNDLVQKYTWSDVESVFLQLYPDESQALETFASAYDELRDLEPVASELNIVVEQIWNETDKQHFMDVYGKTKGERFGLDVVLWPELLGMQINESTLAHYSEEEIISHCLYEMTTWGHTLAEVTEYRDRVFSRPELTKAERAYFEWEHVNAHPVTQVEVVGRHSLHVAFDDGTEATIDLEHALRTIYNAGMYEPLRDPNYFAQVKLDENGILTWPNGADFNPAYIYRWDEHLAMWQHEQET
jgi:hypothetical protein